MTLNATLIATLREQEAAWEARPLLRRVYREWYRLVASRLARVPGPTVELGSGIGRLAEVVPNVVLTDVEPTPWATAVVDAEDLPYHDATVANLVLIDVLHHVAHPSRFLDEAARVLAPGGRAVLLEPYCSPVSTLAYRWVHHEDLDLDTAGFDGDPSIAAAAMDANIATPTVVFYRRRAEFERSWPELRIVERRRLTFFLYVLTGGFSRRPLLPAFLFRPLAALERALTPLARLLAFRCLIVLERRG